MAAAYRRGRALPHYVDNSGLCHGCGALLDAEWYRLAFGDDTPPAEPDGDACQGRLTRATNAQERRNVRK
jgi:hypothetical protein